MELVGGERKRIDTEVRNVDGDMPHSLYGIGVERDVVGMGGARKLADGFDRADLVVGEHDGHQRDIARIAGKRGFQVFSAHATV